MRDMGSTNEVTSAAHQAGRAVGEPQCSRRARRHRGNTAGRPGSICDQGLQSSQAGKKQAGQAACEQQCSRQTRKYVNNNRRQASQAVTEQAGQAGNHKQAAASCAGGIWLCAGAHGCAGPLTGGHICGDVPGEGAYGRAGARAHTHTRTRTHTHTHTNTQRGARTHTHTRTRTHTHTQTHRGARAHTHTHTHTYTHTHKHTEGRGLVLPSIRFPIRCPSFHKVPHKVPFLWPPVAPKCPQWLPMAPSGLRPSGPRCPSWLPVASSGFCRSAAGRAEHVAQQGSRGDCSEQHTSQSLMAQAGYPQLGISTKLIQHLLH